MKPQNFYQEILLFTSTSFASREFISYDDDNERQNYSSVDKLEMACWDGLLEVMLPELMNADSSKNESFTWMIHREKKFLGICMGSYDAPVLNQSSIDPYFFMAVIHIN